MNKTYLFGLLCFFGYVSAITYKLESNTEECFFEVVREKPVVILSYELVSGDAHGFDVNVKNGDNVLYTKSELNEDDTHFTAEKGQKLSVCFKNRAGLPKTLSFRFQAGAMISSEKHGAHSDFVTEHDMDALGDKVHELSTEIFAMQDEQRYTRTKQFYYKDGLSKMSKKLLFASLFEIVVMIICCFLQFLHFRNLIATRKLR
ncbi:hypothetical protein WA158_006444 [Blastocystis sp. Blastoise]